MRGENWPIASCTATRVSDSTTLVSVTSAVEATVRIVCTDAADPVTAVPTMPRPIDRQQRHGQPDAGQHAGQRQQPQPSLGQVAQPEALNPPHDCGHPWITTTTVIYPATPGPTVRACIVSTRPVVADASATHGVALISLPALGAVQTRRRARDAVIRLVDGLVGESLELGERGPRRRARVSHRIASLAAPIRAVEPPDDDVDLRFVAAVVRGNVRLLAGMVRANRPWRLIVRLSRALAAAAAAVVFALVTADLWVLADALNWLRLLVLTVLSVGATVLWLIVSHRLWEARQGRGSRQQTVLFNAATTLTLLLGAASLYAALFALTIGAAALVIDAGVLGEALGHDADVGDYAALAWMASSLATIAGGLGAGLESDEAVREAAYGYRVERASERDSRSIESAVGESNRQGLRGVGSG